MKNYHGQEEIITAGDYVMQVTDSGKICRAYVQRTDGDLLELQFSDEDYVSHRCLSFLSVARRNASHQQTTMKLDSVTESMPPNPLISY